VCECVSPAILLMVRWLCCECASAAQARALLHSSPWRGMALLDDRADQRTGTALLDNRADQRTGMALLDNGAVQEQEWLF